MRVGIVVAAAVHLRHRYSLFVAACFAVSACEWAPPASPDVGDASPGLVPTHLQPPNILLVCLDTVRYDRTSLAGGPRDTTPHLARLATQGVSFDQTYSVANESLFSHAAMFTGRFPSEIALPDYASFSLPATAQTLAGALRANGYQTAAFTGGGHVTASFGFNSGFDSFVAPEGLGEFASFDFSVPHAKRWIKGQSPHVPWFAFVHGYDAHAPYVRPEPFRHYFGDAGATSRVERLLSDPLASEQVRGNVWYPDRQLKDFAHAVGRPMLGTDFYRWKAEPRPGERVEVLTAEELSHIRDHYDTGLAYGDAGLGLLLGEIDLSRTVVMVVADHGEDLLDHGYMNHRAGLWDSTTHVPFVVAGPGFSAGQRRSELVDLRSVTPSLLAVAGAKPMAGVRAPAIQSLPPSNAVFAEGVMDEVSMRTPSLRLVVRNARLAAADSLTTLGDGKFETADISMFRVDEKGMEGPDLFAGGAVDVPPTAEAAAMLAEIRKWRSGLDLATEPGTAISDELRARLREQGYWVPGDVPTQ